MVRRVCGPSGKSKDQESVLLSTIYIPHCLPCILSKKKHGTSAIKKCKQSLRGKVRFKLHLACPVIIFGFPPSHITHVSWPRQCLHGPSFPWNYIWPDRRGDDTLFLSGCKQILTALSSAWWQWWIDALWQGFNSSTKSVMHFLLTPGYIIEPHIRRDKIKHTRGTDQHLPQSSDG